jgi:hypothetical protein
MSHIIKLRKPIGLKGKEITEITLREPTAGEVLEASTKTGRGLALSLLSQVTGIDSGIIEMLPGRVSDKALGYLMTFVDPILSDAVDAEEPPEELIVALDNTIEMGTTWVNELTLREPTLGELIKGDKYTGMQRTIALVALVSGQPRAVIERVPISKFATASRYVIGFIDAAPESGEKSSDD